MEQNQIKGLEHKKKVRYFTVNIIWIAALIVLIISAILSSSKFGFYIFSILTRFLEGIGIVSNGFCWVLSSYWPFNSKNMTKRKQQVGGILLIIVGLIGVITSLMGYGFNGHSPFPWWEYLK